MRLLTSPQWANAQIHQKQVQFSGDEPSRKKLYEPIQPENQDRFERTEKKRLYKPIDLPLPPPPTFPTFKEPEPAKQLPQPAKSVPVTTHVKVTKENFLSEDLALLESMNPSVDIQQMLDRRMNVQTTLHLLMRSVSSLAAMVGTHGWGAPLLPFIDKLSGSVSGWLANKISDTVVGRTISGAANFVKTRWNRLLGWFDGRKSDVRFAGPNTSQKTSTTGNEQKTASKIMGSVDNFLQKVNNPSRTETKPEVAKQLFGSIFTSLAELVAQEGSPAEKAKAEKLTRFHSDLDSLSNELPRSAKVFNDIPAPTRRKLLSVIYDALTSDVPEIIQWGEGVGQDLGISQERINQIKGSAS